MAWEHRFILTQIPCSKIETISLNFQLKICIFLMMNPGQGSLFPARSSPLPYIHPTPHLVSLFRKYKTNKHNRIIMGKKTSKEQDKETFSQKSTDTNRRAHINKAYRNAKSWK